MGDFELVDLTPENIADYGVCGYKNVRKHRELRKKIDWFKEYYPKGLRIKVAASGSGGYLGMLEYIPGEYAHRPVEAGGYMFIHCIFVGLKKEHKGRGYASALIEGCVEEAGNSGMRGVAAVARKGSFMARKDIFLKKEFRVVDSAEPDFELVARKFEARETDPRFKPHLNDAPCKFSKGLTVIRSPQCPYTEKNVNAILESARNNFGLETELVDLKDHGAAQNSPCAFGTFCLVHNNEIISHHPISKTRFENIMNKRTG